MDNDEATFSADTDARIVHSNGDETFFGRDVLRGLVGGLREELEKARSRRRWGTGILGCSMWLDDPELIDLLHETENVCILVTKQSHAHLRRSQADPVRQLAEKHGFIGAALSEFEGWAPRVDGDPRVLGPYEHFWSERNILQAVREVGFRKTDNHLVPIVHAKIAVIGDMAWTDEHPSGHVVDDSFFRPRRLWAGSANFTKSSRRSLETGRWTSEPQSVDGAYKFLLKLIQMSEPLGTGPDAQDPEMVPVEYDDAAFFEYLGDL